MSMKHPIAEPGSSSTIVDLSGRTAIVTGANRGMGKETARELARMGCTVVLACRDHSRGDAVAAEIKQTSRGNAVALQLDLSSLASVHEFAAAFNKRYSALDVLVNNAAASLRTREITADGFERHWATNVLGPHLLTKLMLPALEASGDSRIVTVSTLAAGGLDLSDTQYERRRYSGLGAYRASKQAIRMLTWSLANRLDATRVTANALNPGYVLTDLTTNVSGLMKVLILLTRFKAVTPREGADTAIWLAASREVESVSGQFWNKRRQKRCKFGDSPAVDDLWRLVEQQLTASARLDQLAPEATDQCPGEWLGERKR
jgi:NAD(P)-dependent dehydrogenase (short-subunit alcohol dehydrogenase family)